MFLLKRCWVGYIEVSSAVDNRFWYLTTFFLKENGSKVWCFACGFVFFPSNPGAFFLSFKTG